jgi:hypothetical protein
MVASVSEMQASNNQKQCFDMLIVRLMHVADMPPVSELLKQAPEKKPAAPKPVKEEKKAVVIESAADLAKALQESKELLLFTYYSSNIEISEFEPGRIKYYDRKGDADFAQKLNAWLTDATGKMWNLERVVESMNKNTITEQKHEEAVADPLVADALSLFGDAQIVGIK